MLGNRLSFLFSSIIVLNGTVVRSYRRDARFLVQDLKDSCALSSDLELVIRAEIPDECLADGIRSEAMTAAYIRKGASAPE